MDVCLVRFGGVGSPVILAIDDSVDDSVVVAIVVGCAVTVDTSADTGWFVNVAVGVSCFRSELV